MLFDLNVPWSENSRELQRTVAFLDELGYDVVALSQTYLGRLPTDLTPSIPTPLPFPTPRRMRLLRRCTISLTDSASNFRIPALRQHYDLVAARPTDERTLQAACHSLDVDIISLDLTQKFDKHFRYPMLGAAIAKGVKIELCYSQPIMTGDPTAKRNAISNATQLVRVTRGRGLLFSSEAKSALALRAPSDIVNLATVWGLGPERGKDALSKEPRSVVEFARLKTESFKGIVRVIHGGEKPKPVLHETEREKHKQKAKSSTNANGKRPGDSLDMDSASTGKEQEKPLSKRQMKKLKKEKMQAESSVA